MWRGICKTSRSTTGTGLKLVEVDAQVEHFDFRNKESKFSLDHLKVKNDIDEQGDVINNTVQTEIGKLHLPSALTAGEEVIVSYVGHLAIRRLDAEALSALQTTAHQLYKQNDDPRRLMEMNSKFMEILPQFLAKSPEIALTELTVTTSKGTLQGRASARINGKKVTSLEMPLALIGALQAQAEFSIDKTLLEQMLMMVENQSPREARVFREKIKMFVALKWLIKTDASYKAAASFKNGQLTVNGQKIPLPF